MYGNDQQRSIKKEHYPVPNGTVASFYPTPSGVTKVQDYKLVSFVKTVICLKALLWRQFRMTDG